MWFLSLTIWDGGGEDAGAGSMQTSHSQTALHHLAHSFFWPTLNDTLPSISHHARHLPREWVRHGSCLWGKTLWKDRHINKLLILWYTIVVMFISSSNENVLKVLESTGRVWPINVVWCGVGGRPLKLHGAGDFCTWSWRVTGRKEDCSRRKWAWESSLVWEPEMTWSSWRATWGVGLKQNMSR